MFRKTIFKIEVDIKKQICGNSQVVLWLGLHVSTAGGTGSIIGWGTKFPYASWPKHHNIKQKQYYNKFNKYLKNGTH